ncbi:hypothetical protein [Flavobacterium beibuense]|uniref:Type II secretion system protein GspC N-terminal domain-containing protein n=1 Tax=Flavobacterium beibuense TaxID=657326 RepID=A0A444W842_9FLAO|nr:hypothetical protein [Flavobacterium beibuense]RYJ42040.1 hypothetical protein NU09_2444 [Flavobacterium beibuense]
MKNKKNIYILLPIVLLIWGMVIYRLFSFTNPETDTTIASSTVRLKPLDIKERDTFSIDVNYRDPFLGKMYRPESQKTLKTHSVKTIKEPIVWPAVIYKGIVSESNGKKKVFMLSINGKTYFMTEKTTEEGVTLKKGNRSTIEVIYKGEKNEILLQE